MKVKKRCGKGSITSRSICKKKTAMESSTMVFYYMACILFACFVAYTYIRIAYTGAKSTKFSMEFFVNDMGLMTDSIYAVPGDVDYDYRKNPSKFIFDFRNSSLYVYSPVETTKANMDVGTISSSWSAYNYLFRTEHQFIKKFVFPTVISFKKIGSMLDISSTGVFNEIGFCPEIDTAADMKQINITIDPGHYPSEPGYQYTGQSEYQITKQIADSLLVLCRSHSMNCRVLAQKSIAEKTAEMNTEPKPNMIISLHIGDYSNPDDKPFRARYLIGSSKGEKIACLISNQFRKDYIVLESEQVIPFMRYGYDYNAFMQDNIPSVALEIGNMKNSMGIQSSSINDMASSIIKGIEEYYKKSSTGTENVELEGFKAEKSEETEQGQATDKSKVKVIVR